ncbi:MAG: MmgE/PrpD family protein [Betaproteobacteria bacterium]|nr:MmgE/PrpD family protein [Betaproteobacteria bacterium]
MRTERLAGFVIDTPAASIPRELLSCAADAFLDTVGVALAGTREPASQLAVRWVQGIGGNGVASVWGTAVRAPAAEAAFANGVAAHALDFDDSLPSLRSHPSATMVPTALAVGEATGASGRDVAGAYVLGLEVAGKLGKALGNAHFQRGWHTTATIGIFACTAVAGRLLGLDTRGLQTAWGIAASQMSGLTRNFSTMTKPLHAGHAARCAVMSASLAHSGFTADTAIFDGDRSVVATYGSENGTDLAGALDQLGAPWEIVNPGIYVKRWACCYCNHRPLGGLFQLLSEHQIATEEVESVSIGFLPGSDTALLSSNPSTGLEGKFSIEYVVAAALLDRRITLETFTDDMVRRPRIRELIGKVRRYRIEDDGVYSGLVGHTDVEIATRRGRFRLRVEKTPGSPAWPVSAEDRVAKFLDCSGRVLGEEGARHVLALGRLFTQAPDVATFARAMQGRAADERTRAPAYARSAG